MAMESKRDVYIETLLRCFSSVTFLFLRHTIYLHSCVREDSFHSLLEQTCHTTTTIPQSLHPPVLHPPTIPIPTLFPNTHPNIHPNPITTPTTLSRTPPLNPIHQRRIQAQHTSPLPTKISSLKPTTTMPRINLHSCRINKMKLRWTSRWLGFLEVMVWEGDRGEWDLRYVHYFLQYLSIKPEVIAPKRFWVDGELTDQFIRDEKVPVVIPQTAPGLQQGFSRAWAPILETCGVRQHEFVQFLDHLNVCKAASPPLQVMNLAGTVLGFTFVLPFSLFSFCPFQQTPVLFPIQCV